MVVPIVMSFAITSAATEPCEIDAERWRKQQLETIARHIQKSGSTDERRELVARQSWLRRWQPGQMPFAPKNAPEESDLVEEPSLGRLTRPAAVAPDAWQKMIYSQERLLDADTVDLRKPNLKTIISLATDLERLLADQLPPELHKLETPSGWALAYARYRLGRALAYRELPPVRARWPITNPDDYEQTLVAAYERLTNQTGKSRPEFILLEDRMLRRAGKKGLALELLEANRQSIEPKWYLKKRRDLLKELGWDPPHEEAAQLYLDAGYQDEPSIESRTDE